MGVVIKYPKVKSNTITRWKSQAADDYFKDPIFIVASHEPGFTAYLKSLSGVVRSGMSARAVVLTGILKLPLVGDDGKEVDFRVGSLISMTIRKDIEGAFHICNAVPSTAEGYKQWAWAKCVLGINTDFLLEEQSVSPVTDGQFRKANLKLVEDPNRAEIQKVFDDLGLEVDITNESSSKFIVKMD